MDPHEIKQRLLAPFDVAEIRIRDKPSIQPYVTARVVMSRLDEVLPFGWSFSLGASYTDPNGTLIQPATLTVWFGDRPLMFSDVGSAPPDVGKAPAKQAKQAVSDAFKRCAVHVGIGRYLYELAGVRADGIPEKCLKRALPAVGYRGGYERNHWGAIGGIRELDSEDEDDPAPEPPPRSQARPSSQDTPPADDAPPPADESTREGIAARIRDAFETRSERLKFAQDVIGDKDFAVWTFGDCADLSAALRDELARRDAEGEWDERYEKAADTDPVPISVGVLGPETPPTNEASAAHLAAVRT